MKKAVKILMIVFIAAAVLTAAGAAFFFYKDSACAKTAVPENLSATAVVQKYFEYWNSGNAKGMALLTYGGDVAVSSESKDNDAAPDMNAGKKADKNYLPSLDMFCKIEYKNCVLLEQKAEQYKNFADNAIVSVDFTYEKSFGFGDENIPESAKRWEFHLIRESKDSQWKIISVKSTAN